MHDALRERARRQGRTISQYVLDLIRHDLRRPDDDAWMAAWESLEPIEGLDVVSLIDGERGGRDDTLGERGDRL